MEDTNVINRVNLDMSCPMCQKGQLYMLYKVTVIPYFGGIVLMTIKCDQCSLKISDIMAVSEKGDLPGRYEVKTSEKHMGDLFVLSAGSHIEIPELDIEIYISSEAGGEITTLEGILTEAIDLTKSLFNTSNTDEREKLEDIMTRLNNEIKNPSGALTVLLIDENRRSAVIPNEIWAKRTEEERIKALTLSEKQLINMGREVLRKKIQKN